MASLIENFCASSAGIDGSLLISEFRPLSARKVVVKNHSAAENCMAVSDSHIFVANSAVVHVFKRENGSKEAAIPFKEQITSITLALGGTVLFLGTEGGRLLLWEICTGRLVTTGQHHLQAITCLTADSASNFLLSGSLDSKVHAWNILDLISFTTSDGSHAPVRTLSKHRGPITCLSFGHVTGSAPLVVTAGTDRELNAWELHSETLLRTYLTPKTATALTFDAADRGCLVGYEDGTLQLLDFYALGMKHASIFKQLDPHTPISVASNRAHYQAESQNLGRVHSLSISWDNTMIISGHESGNVATWNMDRGRFATANKLFNSPVTNVMFLPPTGFLNQTPARFKVHNVVKPSLAASMDYLTNPIVPAGYAFHVQFMGDQNDSDNDSGFFEALNHPGVPASLIDEGNEELAAWSAQAAPSQSAESAEFLPLDGTTPQAMTQAQQIEQLKEQLAAVQRVQQVSFEQLAEFREEKRWWLEEQTRLLRIIDGSSKQNCNVGKASDPRGNYKRPRVDDVDDASGDE